MLLSLAVLFLLSLTLAFAFERFRLPGLLGMLLCGIILGRSGFNFIDQSLLSISYELRQIAMIVILLRAGLSLSVAELKQVGRPAAMMSFVPALFEIGAVVAVAGFFLGLNFGQSLLLATVLAAVSPAVVVPRMLGMISSGRGTKKGIPQLIMAGCSIDDIFVIVLFSVALVFASQGEFHWQDLGRIPVSIILGILLGVVSGLFLSFLFKRVHLRDTVKVLVMLSFGFLFITLENAVKDHVAISALLSVMCMGLALRWAYPELCKRLLLHYARLWVAFELLLFVLVGASVDLSIAFSFGFAALALVVVALLVRSLGVAASLVGTSFTYRERLFCAFSYLPKATVQAAIGGVPLAMGIAGGDVILSISVLAIIISAPLGAIAIDLSRDRLVEG